ncbi:MAG: polyhydroxyalkanoate synthesis repressor PhaR [Magnetococcales bacterium]|nr:polyhydroxyalkanoate synthesis repressor PhaR [Magnetococcales bacterium]NGZ29311.1 polyhydroxyalkanoate synthesis repressor PhaR [Magnetococcales bacterium]
MVTSQNERNVHPSLTDPSMSPARIIKKYPNRRLYDTETSSYVTLDGIKKLVEERTPFKVVDIRTNEEITRNILLQIISELEDRGNPVFSIELLERVIRFYGSAMQGALSDYLEQSLALFLEQQKLFQKHLESPLTPVTSPLTQLMEENLSLWKKWQESLLITPFAFRNKDDSEKG